jgi:predicted CoA-binding protein
MGASDNPGRYSYLAIHRLRGHGHPVRAIGRHAVRVLDVDVQTEMVPWTDIDTITLYLNPTHQEPYYDYFISLKPRRIIFNPGTENPELERLASEAGIDCLEACTLVMLSTGQYD